MSATCPVCATPVAPDAAYCHACGAAQPARCPACGTPRHGADAFCPECGAALPAAPATEPWAAPPGARIGAPDAAAGPGGAAQPVAAAIGVATFPPPWGPPRSGGVFRPFDAPAAPVRQRPSWMAAALVVVTFGLYWLVWFGQTWAEMKRLVGDPGMSPFWHALTPLVPVYGLFRTHAHFRVMAVLLGSSGLPPAVAPSLAVGLALLAGGLNWVSLRPGVGAAAFVVLTLLALAAFAWLVARGQAALNALWRHEFGAGARTGAHWGEWLALVACGLVFALFVLGGLIG